MHAETILELLPYHCVEHSEQVDVAVIKQLMKKYDKGLFVLPTEHSTVEDLKIFLGLGVKLVLEHSDNRSYSLSSKERNELIIAGREQVFLKGYSDGHCQVFLQEGASLLIDGEDTQLSVAAIAQLCRQARTGMIKLVPHGFSYAQRLDLLGRGIGVVFSRKQGELIYPVAELEAMVEEGKQKVIISGSDFSAAEALSLLQLGATLILAGDMSWNRATFEVKVFNKASAADRTRIKVLPRFGSLAKRQELKAIAQDLGLAVVEPSVLFN